MSGNSFFTGISRQAKKSLKAVCDNVRPTTTLHLTVLVLLVAQTFLPCVSARSLRHRRHTHSHSDTGIHPYRPCQDHHREPDDIASHLEDIITSITTIAYAIGDLKSLYAEHRDIEENVVEALEPRGFPDYDRETDMTHSNIEAELRQYYHDIVRLVELWRVAYDGELHHHQTQLAPTFREILESNTHNLYRLLCQLRQWMDLRRYSLDREELDRETLDFLGNHMELNDNNNYYRQQRDMFLMHTFEQYLNKLKTDVGVAKVTL